MKTARDTSLDATIGKFIARGPISNRFGVPHRATPIVPRHFAPRNLVVLGIFLALPLAASVSGLQLSAPSIVTGPVNVGQTPFPDPYHGMDDISREQFQKQLKELNIQRQRQLTSDSVKLLALAAELKSEVEKAGNADPTPNQLHKAELIEKLAHSVRDKMKDANSPAESMPPMRRK